PLFLCLLLASQGALSASGQPLNQEALFGGERSTATPVEGDQQGSRLDAYLSLAVVVSVFFGLIWLRGVPIELLFLSGLAVVTLLGVIKPAEAVSAFAYSAVFMIAALFAAAAGLSSTGAFDWIGSMLLGSATTVRSALTRIAATVVPVSAFVLNSPL